MEQTIVDFLAKSSELILLNRLPPPKPQDSPQSHHPSHKQPKFQLSFEQKFNFSTKIPSQWTSNSNKVLVLEFFLVNKITKEKFLAEQWLFELNQVSGGKLKDTIDSPSTLYKKLAVLLRSISLLAITLPLYKTFVIDKSSLLNEHYSIEHSINFTRHTLSSWHSNLHEEKNLAIYNNPELIIPGRAFIFKVNYPKSLDFLEMMVGEQIGLETGNLKLLKEKLDIDYFKPRRERAISDQNRNLHSIRKSTSDSSNKINTSGGNMSPKEHYPIGSEGVSENLSPFGSLFGASPIETQLSPRQVAELKRKNSGGSYPWENKNGAGNRPRFGTIDSASSGEYDMYIYEDGDFTEVVSVREINVRDESPRKFSMHPRASEDEQTFGEASRRAGSHDLKLSPNASNKIDKLIEQSDDDKIAEIIRVVDELKDHLHSTMTQEISQKSSFKTGGSDESGNEKIGRLGQKGFKFYSIEGEIGGENKNGSTLSADYEGLINLYNKIKK